MDHSLHMLGVRTDSMLELSYAGPQAHPQPEVLHLGGAAGPHVEDLNALWYDTEGTWDAVHKQAAELDERIDAFNEASGVLKSM